MYRTLLLTTLLGGLYAFPLLAQEPNYAARRASFERQLSPRSIGLLFSPPARTQSADIQYPFTPSKNLRYLSGYTDAQGVLLCSPTSLPVPGQPRSLLFIPQPNEEHARWHGIQPSLEQVAQNGSFTIVYPLDSLTSVLSRLQADTLYSDSWLLEQASNLSQPQDPLHRQAKMLWQRFPAKQRKDAAEMLVPMRERKDAYEIEQLRQAARISAQAHAEVARQLKAGMSEKELEGLFEYLFKKGGAEGLSYPAIVGSGPNGNILHYSSNNRPRIASGETVLLDVGAAYGGYAADITRTLPVNGRFTPAQQTIYDLVLRAQQAAIAVCKPGTPFHAIDQTARDTIAKGLLQLSIIQDIADVNQYFPHGTSHHLGLDVHDPSEYGPLEANMALTVEPGIYIPAGSPCDPKWWNIFVRIEDDILVTGQGPENLSIQAPK